jgi:hypothetical protein
MFMFRKILWPEQFDNDVFGTRVSSFVFDYVCCATSKRLFPSVDVALAAVREIDHQLASQWASLFTFNQDELESMDLYICDDGELVTVNNLDITILKWCEDKLVGQRKPALDIIRAAFLEVGLKKDIVQEGNAGEAQLSAMLKMAFSRGQMQHFLCGDNMLCVATVVLCLFQNEGWTADNLIHSENLRLAVGQLSLSQLKDFLRFVIASETISSRARILVDANSVPGSLPAASTCTKTLSIPLDCPYADELKNKLLVSIESGLKGGFTRA